MHDLIIHKAACKYLTAECVALRNLLVEVLSLLEDEIPSEDIDKSLRLQDFLHKVEQIKAGEDALDITAKPL